VSHRRPQILIIGDSEADAAALAVADNVGALLARLGCTVVTGGRGGIMEAACRGARRAGGATVGIIPTTAFDDANAWCSIVIPTGFGHGRNALTALAGDLVVVIGGGAGTLSEIALAWIHGRPILALAGSGGWADLLARVLPDGRGSSTVVQCADLASLEAAIRSICRARGLPLL
jgi:uncharacterized protein (TIGR00725 family)